MRFLPSFLAILSSVMVSTGHAQDAPAAPPVAPEASALETRAWKVPANLLDPDAGGGAVDAFAGEPPKKRSPLTSFEEQLEKDLGISFTEGTWVRFDPQTGRLEIRHEPAVVDAIETYLEAVAEPHYVVVVRVERYQMPALMALQLQRETAALDDDTPALPFLDEQLAKGTISLVHSASLQSRSGQRAKFEDIAEIIYPTELEWKEEGKAFSPEAFETRNIGTLFETDVVLGADYQTIDINFYYEFHTAPPVMQPIKVVSPESGELNVMEMPEFHTKRVTTQITFRAGTAKVIGAWRPTGKPEYEALDVMQVALMRLDLQEVRSVVRLPEAE